MVPCCMETEKNITMKEYYLSSNKTDSLFLLITLSTTDSLLSLIHPSYFTISDTTIGPFDGRTRSTQVWKLHDK